MIWRMEKKEDKVKRIQLRKGVKMSTEEYQNLLICCVATEIHFCKERMSGISSWLCYVFMRDDDTCDERLVLFSFFLFSLGRPPWGLSNSRNFVYLTNQGHQMLL